VDPLTIVIALDISEQVPPSPEAMPALHPLDPLAADGLALGTQLGMDAWRIIGVPGGEHEELTIGDLARVLRGVSARRGA
jgi:hypothetical protein